MIFVTVGTHTVGFERLVRAIDALARDIPESVLAQIGPSSYTPLHARWFRFAQADEIEGHLAEARVIITHAGAGSLLGALRYDAAVIATPRRREYGECIDDHQLELASALAAAGQVTLVEDLATLPAVVERVERGQRAPRASVQLQTAIAAAARELVGHKLARACA